MPLFRRRVPEPTSEPVPHLPQSHAEPQAEWSAEIVIFCPDALR